MAGKILPPSARRVASAADLPKYNPETKQIEYDGKVLDAPEGTKFETDDGKMFILHHARMVKGGWKAMRPPKPKTDAAATTESAPAKRK